jgi:hypothetical protein
MRAPSNSTYLMIIIAALVLPSAVSLSWFHVTQNPSLRPLGLTREALRAYTGGYGDNTMVVARVVGADPSDDASEALARALVNAFAAKGVELEVAFLPGTGPPRVSYAIGTSVIGPYPASRAAQGVSAAVDAYRMKVPVAK